MVDVVLLINGKIQDVLFGLSMIIGKFGNLLHLFLLEKKRSKKFKTLWMYPCEEDTPTGSTATTSSSHLSHKAAPAKRLPHPPRVLSFTCCSFNGILIALYSIGVWAQCSCCEVRRPESIRSSACLWEDRLCFLEFFVTFFFKKKSKRRKNRTLRQSAR